MSVYHLFHFFWQALEKAKEAGRKERMLVRQREQLSAGEQINLDLTYSVSCDATDLIVASSCRPLSCPAMACITKDYLRLKIKGNGYVP